MPESPTASPVSDLQLDVIVVSYNAVDLLRRCVDELTSGLRARDHVKLYIVDNASGSPTREYLGSLRDRPEVELMFNSRNLGFARGVNQALARSQAPWILLLNPDTEVDLHMVRRLITRAEELPRVGALGCRLEQRDGRIDPACKRQLPTLRSAALHALTRLSPRLGDSAGYLAFDVPNDAVVQVGALNGAFVLAPRSTYDRVGLLDESYWMYGEDLDWFRRVQRAGLAVWYVGTERAVHVKAGSSGRVRGWRTNWHFHSSMVRYYASDDLAVGERLLVPVVVLGVAISWLGETLRYLRFKLRREA